MGISIKRNKSKEPFYRIKFNKTNQNFTLGLPGFTITITTNFRYKKSSKQGSTTPVEYIKSTSMEYLLNEDTLALAPKFRTRIKLNKLSNWIIYCTLSLGVILFLFHMIYIGYFSLILTLLATLIKLYLYSLGRISMVVNNQESLVNHTKRISSWERLNTCESLWQVTGYLKASKSDTNYKLYERVPLKIKKQKPFFLKVNYVVLKITLESHILYLLPESILVVEKSNQGFIKYSNLTTTVTTIPYFETETVPSDATILEYSWQYANKDGSPDKRYKDNPQMPICQYIAIDLSTKYGYHVILLCSNSKISPNLQYL